MKNLHGLCSICLAKVVSYSSEWWSQLVSSLLRKYLPSLGRLCSAIVVSARLNYYPKEEIGGLS